RAWTQWTLQPPEREEPRPGWPLVATVAPAKRSPDSAAGLEVWVEARLRRSRRQAIALQRRRATGQYAVARERAYPECSPSSPQRRPESPRTTFRNSPGSAHTRHARERVCPFERCRNERALYSRQIAG